MSNYLTSDGLKNFFSTSGGPTEARSRPVAFATSATWLIRHCNNLILHASVKKRGLMKSTAPYFPIGLRTRVFFVTRSVTRMYFVHSGYVVTCHANFQILRIKITCEKFSWWVWGGGRAPSLV